MKFSMLILSLFAVSASASTDLKNCHYPDGQKLSGGNYGSENISGWSTNNIHGCPEWVTKGHEDVMGTVYRLKSYSLNGSASSCYYPGAVAAASITCDAVQSN